MFSSAIRVDTPTWYGEHICKLRYLEQVSLRQIYNQSSSFHELRYNVCIYFPSIVKTMTTRYCVWAMITIGTLWFMDNLLYKNYGIHQLYVDSVQYVSQALRSFR